MIVWSTQFAYLLSFICRSIAMRITVSCQTFVWTIDSPFPDLPLSTDAISCDLDKLFGSYHSSYHGRHQNVQVLSNIRIRFEFAGQKCGSIRLSRFRRVLQFFTNIASFQIYRFLIADYNLRRFFNLNAYCGAVTFATLIFVVIMAVCSIVVSLL